MAQVEQSLPPPDRDLLNAACEIADRALKAKDPTVEATLARPLASCSSSPPGCDVRTGDVAISKEPRINIDRIVNQVVLDCSLLRLFSYNGRRQDGMIAIDVRRSRARDLEDQILDFLLRHCGGAQ